MVCARLLYNMCVSTGSQKPLSEIVWTFPAVYKSSQKVVTYAIDNSDKINSSIKIILHVRQPCFRQTINHLQKLQSFFVLSFKGFLKTHKNCTTRNDWHLSSNLLTFFYILNFLTLRSFTFFFIYDHNTQLNKKLGAVLTLNNKFLEHSITMLWFK